MSGLYLPPSVQQDGEALGVLCQFEPYDSELLPIQMVMGHLANRYAHHNISDLDAFSDEVIDRFASIGILACPSYEVAIRPSTGESCLVPSIVLLERLDDGPFDHERMTWEVRNDASHGAADNLAVKPDGTVELS